MTAADFLVTHGTAEVGTAQRALPRWEQEAEIDRMLASTVGGGVVIGDLMVGDGLRDQVSPELRDAFASLMGDRASSYDQVRAILLDKVRTGDRSVLGLVSKIKGQIGENQFVTEADALGLKARLASSGSQEAWDVAVDRADGTVQYVQVKMYGDANGVVGHIDSIEQKLRSGHLVTDNETVVTSIDFAVPADIANEVATRAAAIGYTGEIIPIQMTASEAAAVVEQGVDAVGREALSHLFNELTGGALVAGALHAMVNGFLWYKGDKSASEFLSGTAEGTAVSSGGLVAGFAVEGALSKLAWVGGVPTYALVLTTSIATRGVLSRLVGRSDYVSWVRERTEELRGWSIAISSRPSLRLSP